MEAVPACAIFKDNVAAALNGLPFGFEAWSILKVLRGHLQDPRL